MESLPNFGSRMGSITTITKALVAKDVSQGVDWVESLPATEVGANAYQEIAHAWFKQDPLAVSEWAGQLPEGVPRDGAARALVDDLIKGSRADFAAAEAWALSINQGRSTYMLGRVYRAWLSHDRPAGLVEKLTH
ncbi:MAG: hypothetical protein ACKVHP_10335 [Verrucomicrobiales bacterium]